MNREWSELNKTMQQQIKKQETFDEGIDTLLLLRKKMMEQILEFRDILAPEDFHAIPFINADGYHSKTIAYSLYHIFRIEDIVANSLIRKEEEIYFTGHYQERMKSPIITTGNELVKQEIADFSMKLNLDALYQYVAEVNTGTTELLKQITYRDLKTKMTEQDRENLRLLGVVSKDESAVWLIDYWCNKNIQGLIKMPFSRHWIMHVEASLRIKNKILR